MVHHISLKSGEKSTYLSMIKYIIRRILTMIPVLLGVTVIISALVYLAPGDPARIALGRNANPEAYQQLRLQMGLDRPPHLRYFDWLLDVLSGNLGQSITTGRPVTQLIIERLPATLELAVGSLILMLAIAIPLGIVSAIWQNSWVDKTSMVFAIFWLSMASFWLALMLILIFAVELDWFPISGRSGAVLSLTGFTYVVLPAVANGTRRAGLLTRMTRSSMVETLSEDYIRTARGKGIGRELIIYVHALKNAMIPIVTLIGLQIPTLFSSSVIIETVFAWPGMGTLLLQAVTQRNYPVIQGIVLVYAVLVIVANLAVDIAYAYLDPRIEYD